MRKISTLVVSVLCMMMPVGAEAQVPTAFVSKGATDIQAQPHTITQTNSGAQWAPIDLMGRVFKIRIKIWYKKWCYIGVFKLLIFNT